MPRRHDWLAVRYLFGWHRHLANLRLMPAFGRQILVYVRDADNHLVQGATIAWTVDGKDRGRIENSDGHGTLTIDTPTGIVEVSVEYDGKTLPTRRLAVDQQDCIFVIPDLHLIPTRTPVFFERHFPAFLGVFLAIIAIVLAFVFDAPTPLQTHIILALFALAGGAIATEISGSMKVDLAWGTKVVIGATGAAGIFVILYFLFPAGAAPR